MSQHFLIIGAQRCGTTWLHDVLAAHPQIAMARPARPEPKVFLSSEAIDASTYRSRFFGHANDECVLGEKSTSYLETPEAPGRVAATLGHPRIVVQLRDPVDRAVSNWQFSRDHGLENRPLNEAMHADLTRVQPWDQATSSVSPFAYVSRGHYARDLQRWIDRFEVYVQFLAEVQSDQGRLGPLYQWLGVNETVRADIGRKPIHASSPSSERLDPQLREDLRSHYATSDHALATLIGRDVPWPTARKAA
ncbi:MAG: sulfotransferase [Ornithinimicrobium sp.]